MNHFSDINCLPRCAEVLHRLRDSVGAQQTSGFPNGLELQEDYAELKQKINDDFGAILSVLESNSSYSLEIRLVPIALRQVFNAAVAFIDSHLAEGRAVMEKYFGISDPFLDSYSRNFYLRFVQQVKYPIILSELKKVDWCPPTGSPLQKLETSVARMICEDAIDSRVSTCRYYFERFARIYLQSFACDPPCMLCGLPGDIAETKPTEDEDSTQMDIAFGSINKRTTCVYLLPAMFFCVDHTRVAQQSVVTPQQPQVKAVVAYLPNYHIEKQESFSLPVSLPEVSPLARSVLIASEIVPPKPVSQTGPAPHVSMSLATVMEIHDIPTPAPPQPPSRPRMVVPAAPPVPPQVQARGSTVRRITRVPAPTPAPAPATPTSTEAAAPTQRRSIGERLADARARVAAARASAVVPPVSAPTNTRNIDATARRPRADAPVSRESLMSMMVRPAREVRQRVEPQHFVVTESELSRQERLRLRGEQIRQEQERRMAEAMRRREQRAPRVRDRVETPVTIPPTEDATNPPTTSSPSSEVQ